MQAAILTSWKQIELREVAAPRPGAGEVLIDVSFAGICGSDVHIFNGDNPIARTPVVQGHEFSGTIAAVGEGVNGLKTGTRVAVQPLVFCGECVPCRRGIPHVCEKLIVIGVNQNGAFANQVAVPTECVFPIPDNLTSQTAALAEPFSIATHSLRRGEIAPSDKVLVVGAGPIGLYTALTARYFGVEKIHVTEPSPARREMASRFGLEASDPSQSGMLQRLRNVTGGDGFDLVIETSGTDAGLNDAVQTAAVHGKIVTLGFPIGGYARVDITRCIVKELSVIASRVCTRSEFVQTLEMLTAMQAGGVVDFQHLVADSRELKDLSRSIIDVENGVENSKILIRPSSN